MAIFVRADHPQAPPGLGKLVALNGTLATVEYFNSPTEDPVVLSFDMKVLTKHNVPTQTRAYWYDRTALVWRVGRVLDGEGERLTIKFPNFDARHLAASDLSIRWDRPIADPMPYLAHFVCETPLLADARSNYVRALIEQRGACLGMSALLSSVIELEAHQFEVVRTVMQDPVQRYLLADEVGLGKTIEAGILIRQYTLDDPSGHDIVVAVPAPLVPQWKDELRRRFFVTTDAPSSRVHVIPTSDLNALGEALKSTGMLVVDEAHHLSRRPDLYRLIKSAAHRIPRLLLLSATPVLRNERGFLEMLHLLDPIIYPLDALESFRRKIEHREALAETVAGLAPENALLLDDPIDRLVARFGDDTDLCAKLDVLRKLASGLPSEDDPELIEALAAVRSHIAEIYRLDRRILRNRRAVVSGLTPDRAGADVIAYTSTPSRRLAEVLRAWRDALALAHYGTENSEAGKHAALWCARLLDAILSFDASEVSALLADPPPGSPPTEELQEAISAAIHDTARLDALLEALRRAGTPTKCVLFCSSPSTAGRVASFLQVRLQHGVLRPTGGNREETLLKFMELPEHRVLICDRSDEEGLNLQGGAKVVIHFDLPLAPNRIEQRIGRLDRYGAGDPIRSFILRSDDDPIELAWTACLDGALGVFTRSIASLQYLIDSEMQSLGRLLLSEGEEAIGEMSSRLGGKDGEVEREFKRIAHQDALDALAKPSDDAIDHLFDVDGRWRSFQVASDAWLVQCLQMTRIPGPNIGPLPPGDRIERFGLLRTGQKPTLIPLDRVVQSMRDAIDTSAPGSSFKSPLTHPYTSNRATALKRKSRSAGVRLLRYGDTLLDGLQAITSLDDRGRSFALWRHDPRYTPEELADAFIRFDFIVEADIGPAYTIIAAALPDVAKTAELSLRRRADMIFPPIFQRIWLDQELARVTDVKLLGHLEAVFRKQPGGDYTDTNLRPSRLDDLRKAKLPVLHEWARFLASARLRSEAELLGEATLIAKAEQAVARAKTIDNGRFARLGVRAANAEGAASELERLLLEREMRVADALHSGITRPRATLDTVGLLLMSNQPMSAAFAKGEMLEDI